MAAAGLPERAGVSLKPQHYAEAVASPGAARWFEVHPENYMGPGGPPHRWLTAVRRDHPLSLHGVGLSLGGSDPLDREHIGRLRALMDRYEPAQVSEHLAWSRFGATHLNDLLPVPYDAETLRLIVRHVEEAQEALNTRLLIENPSRYFASAGGALEEPEFLAELARRSGCGLLVDVNNVVVSAHNLGFEAEAYIRAVPPGLAGEAHLAGHRVEQIGDDAFRIDDHGSAVPDEVWRLFALLVERNGMLPTLVEWDNDVPALPVLLGEAVKADAILAAAAKGADARAA